MNDKPRPTDPRLEAMWLEIFEETYPFHKEMSTATITVSGPPDMWLEMLQKMLAVVDKVDPLRVALADAVKTHYDFSVMHNSPQLGAEDATLNQKIDNTL